MSLKIGFVGTLGNLGIISGGVEDLVSRLVFYPPEQTHIYFKRSVEKIKKEALRPSSIVPRKLYLIMPVQGKGSMRVFTGAYLLDPGIAIPSESEIKQEYTWLKSYHKLPKKKSLSMVKRYDIDDLYEDYLRLAISQFETYVESISRFVSYSGEFYQSLEHTSQSDDFLVSARKELGKAKALVVEYKKKQAPSCMYFPAIKKTVERRLLVKLLEESS